MNTANLQLEGLYVAVSSLMTALRQKGVLTEREMDDILADAEEALIADPKRPAELSPSHLDAIAFPLRYLRVANRRSASGEPGSFSEIAAQVGREKPQQADILAQEREDIEASEDADVRRLEALDQQARGDDGNEEEERQTAENTCRRCHGTGNVGGSICPECSGTGTVSEPVGDA